MTDYYAFLSALFLVILWSTYGLFSIVAGGIHPGAFYTALTLSVIALGLILWRYQSIQTLFNVGIEIPATVTTIWFFRGRGRLDYIYTFRGHEYQSGDDVVPNRNTRSLREADRVTLLVDPDNPGHTLIKDFYL